MKIFWALEICQLALKREIILASSVFTQLAWNFLFIYFFPICMPIQGCGSLHMLLLPPKIFSHFQQNNWEIFGEMYFLE